MKRFTEKSIALKTETIHNPGHPFGYDYNVRILQSDNNGQTWNYCGSGRYCKTEEEAAAYAATVPSEFTVDIPIN